MKTLQQLAVERFGEGGVKHQIGLLRRRQTDQLVRRALRETQRTQADGRRLIKSSPACRAPLDQH